MKISRESRKLARELFRLASPQGRFDSSRASTIAEELVSSRPRGSYGTLKEFTRLVRLELEKHHAVIESAAALSPAEKTKIETDVRSRFGSELTTEFRVAPALIGGLRIQVGSDVWDGSVLARLEDLKQHI
jgi:F-type H+-transporting ATPase subunit delta